MCDSKEGLKLVGKKGGGIRSREEVLRSKEESFKRKIYEKNGLTA